MSSDFQKINTLYLKLFSIQDISCNITSLVVFVLILIYSCPWRRFFSLSNIKSRELKKKNNNNNKGGKIKDSMNALRLNLVITELSLHIFIGAC